MFIHHSKVQKERIRNISHFLLCENDKLGQQYEALQTIPSQSVKYPPITQIIT